MTPPAPTLRRHRKSGIYRVKIHTPRGIQWISTGQTDALKAREVCDQAMVSRLQLSATAGALTADVISRLTTGRRFTCADIRDAWRERARRILSPDSFHGYDTALTAWFNETGFDRQPISAVKEAGLHDYVNARELSLSSRKMRLAALRSFFHYASNAGYCTGNLAALTRVAIRDMAMAQLEPKHHPPITAEEYARLMASPDFTGFPRWSTAFAYWLGWRIRDIAKLEWDSLKTEKFVVWTHKNGRRLELDPSLELFGGGFLHQIIMEICEHTETPHPVYVFPKERGQIMDPRRRSVLSKNYKAALERHNIEGKVFHSLRHACAMRLKGAGWTDEDIKVVLGHSSEITTRIYTGHEISTPA